GAGPSGPWAQLEVRRPHNLVQETTGRGAALRVLLAGEAGGFRVQISDGHWGDKAAGAVEWLLAAPTLVSEGYAAFRRSQLDERVFRTVEAYLGATLPLDRSPAPVPAAGPCPACRAPLPMGGRFCPRCGHDAEAALAFACPGCRLAVAPDAAFCPGCGARLARPGCPRCATPLDPGAAFCSGCGAPAAAAPPQGRTP
ncbi:MAG TPA: zinc ribbon domain-containing protein, partial [Polyangiaceae bacterium]|nr:zinc ribbon domain-containing protein [Polyangiaceae bacterium]